MIKNSVKVAMENYDGYIVEITRKFESKEKKREWIKSTKNAASEIRKTFYIIEEN